MSKLIVVTRAGDEITIEAEAGLSVMQNIRNAGLDELLALCGGNCSCATCHVYLEGGLEGYLAPPSEDENDLLDSSTYRNERSRLSCQLRYEDVLDGLTVRIAPED